MAEAHDHGTRASYRRGCRCLQCRAANANYERRRQIISYPDPAELVDAELAVLHLEALRAQGVGYRQAAKLAGVSPQLVSEIRGGQRLLVRADIASRILGMPAVLAHGQRVTAWRTWRFLDSLKREGFPKGELARRLGLQSPQLQLHSRHVRVKNALRVKRLWQRIMSEDGGVFVIGGKDEQ